MTWGDQALMKWVCSFIFKGSFYTLSYTFPEVKDTKSGRVSSILHQFDLHRDHDVFCIPFHLQGSLCYVGEGNGTPLQYSCLENPMDGGAWWATVHEVGKTQTQLSDFLSLFTFMHWRRKWQPTPVVLPGESQGWGSLVGCRLWGCTESDTLKQFSSSIV